METHCFLEVSGQQCRYFSLPRISQRTIDHHVFVRGNVGRRRTLPSQSIPAAAIAFTGPIFIASALVIARYGDEAFYLVALMMIVYTCMVTRGPSFRRSS